MCSEAMQSSILHIESHHADALPILHDQIKCKVFDEEIGVMTKRLAIKSMENGMTGTISSSSATISLAALAILQ